MSLPLIIYDLTSSPLAMSSMRAIEFLPNIILALFIGVIVDRYNRKWILSLSVLTQIIILLIFFMLLFTSVINLWMIYALGFILYTASFTFGNAFNSTIPNLVPSEQLTEANSSITLASSTINIVGPAFAGMILFTMSYTNALFFTMIGFTILLVFIQFIKIPVQPNVNNQTKIIDDIKDGWKCLIENKDLWALTIVIFLSNIASAITLAVLIFYSLDVLNITESQLGIVLGSAAIGGIIASLIAKHSLKFFRRGVIIILALIIEAMGYGVLALSFTWILLILGMFLIGFSGALMGIHYSTIRQVTTPNYLLGRVAGTSSMFMKLAVPFSFLSAGVLAEFLAINIIFLLSLVITVFLIIYLVKSNVVKIT
jgi:MFS family permease